MDSPVHEPHTPSYVGTLLDNTVFGFMDGLITDMAVVAGMVAAPRSSLYFIVVAALAATLAGSLSMFLGAYMAAHTRYKFTVRERERERREVEEIPEVERQEVRDIYRGLGFTPEETEILVRRITSDKELWIKVMMHEELGFGKEDLHRPRILQEGVIGLSYFVGSFVPIVPFLLLTALPGITTTLGAFVASLALSIIALAGMGAYKERFGEGRPLRGALQMLAVGLGGAAAVYIIVSGIAHLIAP